MSAWSVKLAGAIDGDGDGDGGDGSDLASGSRAFDIEALDHPAWRLNVPIQQSSPEQAAPAEPVEIRGRVQLVDDALISET